MFRIALQVKELVTSNVTSALDWASSPAKMLNQFQRQVEESLIALTSDLNKARRQKDQLKVNRSQAELRAAAWSDKAKIAMNSGREDLAREALVSREEWQATINKIDAENDRLVTEIAGIEEAITDLETKRAEVRASMVDQHTASERVRASKTGSRLDRIARLEKRAEFSSKDGDQARRDTAVERKIQSIQTADRIEEELAAMRQDLTQSASPSAKSARKPAKRVKKV